MRSTPAPTIAAAADFASGGNGVMVLSGAMFTTVAAIATLNGGTSNTTQVLRRDGSWAAGVSGDFSSASSTIVQTGTIAGVRIVGKGFGTSPTDASQGVAMALGYNGGVSNRQLWFGNTEAFGSSTQGVFRLAAGTGIATVDAVRGDDSGRLNLRLATDSTDVCVGWPINDLIPYNQAMPGKLSVYCEAAKVGVAVRAQSTQTGSMQEWQASGGSALTSVSGTGAISSTQPIRPGVYTVATLPTPGTSGRLAYATNARVSGEGAGVGTGSLVTDNGSVWRIAGTNTTAAA